MIAIIAPARNMRPVQVEGVTPTRPQFAAQAAQLAGYLRAYSPWQLESLLDVPPARAFQLYDACRAFSAKKAGSPALLSYVGAAYRNMAPQSFTAEELAFAQRHLRILSAFYGLLRPLDGILEHRLGLKKEFSPGGQDLYTFWGDRLCKALYRQDDLVVNLASVEYARLIKPHLRPGNAMLACRFLVQKPGGVSATVSTVRAARGLMSRFIIENAITDPEDLKAFETDGYRYAPARSTAGEFVFVKERRPSEWAP